MDFKKADEADIEEIFSLVKNAIAVMDQNGIPQWDEIYPAREDFLADIRDQNLYEGIIDGQIAVIYVLNKCQEEAYSFADWSYRGEDFCVLHRFCVNPKFQNRGVAKKTLAYIEEQLRSLGIKAIRLDVFTLNPYALRLYEKAGYHQTGTADWRKGKFLLMEKKL
ncbi:MAG: N-acetyltransferase [Treponema sp.]|nr:N-acetyltransferase [Treponema sp.]